MTRRLCIGDGPNEDVVLEVIERTADVGPHRVWLGTLGAFVSVAVALDFNTEAQRFSVLSFVARRRDEAEGTYDDFVSLTPANLRLALKPVMRKHPERPPS